MSIKTRTIVLAAATAVNAGIVAWVAPRYDAAANIFLLLLAVKSWIFIVLYGLRSNWRATAAGRGLMRLILCIALLCSQGSVTVYAGADYPGRTFVRVVLIGFIALAILDLLITLIAVQRNGGDSE